MTQFEKIQADMYTAMKSGEKEKVNTLRNVLSKLKDRQIEKREALSNEEEINLVTKIAKQARFVTEVNNYIKINPEKR